MKFPKRIFIQRDPNAGRDEENILAWERVENAEDGTIAVYELKELAKKRTETIIE